MLPFDLIKLLLNMGEGWITTLERMKSWQKLWKEVMALKEKLPKIMSLVRLTVF